MPKLEITNVSENGEKVRLTSGNGNLNEVLKPGESRIVEDASAILTTTAHDDGVGEAGDEDAAEGAEETAGEESTEEAKTEE